MSNNQSSNQKQNPSTFGQAHRDPREGIQTDEREARRDPKSRDTDREDSVGKTEEEE